MASSVQRLIKELFRSRTVQNGISSADMHAMERSKRLIELTSSRTRILQFGVFTRPLFMRSRILPGVAIMTCTEKEWNYSEPWLSHAGMAARDPLRDLVRSTKNHNE